MFSSCENLAIYLRQAPSVLRQGETQHWTANRQNENVRNPAANHHEPLERASPLERKHGSVCIDAISSSGYESITFLVVNLSFSIQHPHLRAYGGAGLAKSLAPLSLDAGRAARFSDYQFRFDSEFVGLGHALFRAAD